MHLTPVKDRPNSKIFFAAADPSTEIKHLVLKNTNNSHHLQKDIGFKFFLLTLFRKIGKIVIMIKNLLHSR